MWISGLRIKPGFGFWVAGCGMGWLTGGVLLSGLKEGLCWKGMAEPELSGSAPARMEQNCPHRTMELFSLEKISEILKSNH